MLACLGSESPGKSEVHLPRFVVEISLEPGPATNARDP